MLWRSLLPWTRGLVKKTPVHFTAIAPIPDWLPPTRAMRWTFLGFHHKKLVWFLKVKTMIPWPTSLWPTGVSHSPTSSHPASGNLSKSPFKCFYQFTVTGDSFPGKKISTASPGDGYSPCIFISLIGSWKVMSSSFL